VVVTLVGQAGAKVGATFEYLGLAPACEPCKLKQVCHAPGLQKHRAYRVVEVRKVRHACPADFFEGGMRVAEVEPLPIAATIPASALRGTGVTHTFEECGAVCLYRKLCDTPALAQGTDCRMVEVAGPVDCKVGRDLRFASLEPRRGKA
jgi:uncharacterized protein (UPF0179 family)